MPAKSPKPVAKKPTTTPPTSVTPQPKRSEYVLPEREWDRATELVRMFVATGFLANVRSQSLLLKAEPGSGKTELLERFMGNTYVNFSSDLTARGILKLLRSAGKGAITHIFATEFQKFLMRTASTAENMLGVLTQALEEGVYETHVGDIDENLHGARVGLIGAITEKTFKKRQDMLGDVGFISRVAIIPWTLSFEEMQDVMGRIGRNDLSDLSKIVVPRPDKPVAVTMDEKFSTHIQTYVARSFREHTVLRVYNRFRALAMASAVLERRNTVTAFDVAKVFAFHNYWTTMAVG